MNNNDNENEFNSDNSTQRKEEDKTDENELIKRIITIIINHPEIIMIVFLALT